MIEHLASPSVCVVDDEEPDYRPILDALNALHVSCVHLSGTIASLPDQPFSRLRLIFVDLHLSGTVGKAAASYTANAFTKIVSPQTAPIVVVVWSKYADVIVDEQLPAEDQETEADLFVRTVLEAEPRYQGRLIFIKMPKPMPDARGEDWTTVLQSEIKRVLQGQTGVEALWAWDATVVDGCTRLASQLTDVAQSAVEGTDQSLSDGLKGALQKLTHAQGEGDLTPATAPHHMSSVLSQWLFDLLEHPVDGTEISEHGEWLCGPPAHPLGQNFPAMMSSYLMAAEIGRSKTLYVPGTVYRLTNENAFKLAFGQMYEHLITMCAKSKLKAAESASWREKVVPIAIEISPVCDFVRNRVNSSLVAGLAISSSVIDKKSSKEYMTYSRPFQLRWPLQDFEEQTIILGVCNHFRFTVPVNSQRGWLKPWFRMRELPTSDFRNSCAAYASRVGYVSVE